MFPNCELIFTFVPSLKHYGADIFEKHLEKFLGNSS